MDSTAFRWRSRNRKAVAGGAILLAILGALLFGFNDFANRHRAEVWGLAVVILIGLVALLWERVRRLEQLAAGRARIERIDAQEFLRALRDYHVGRFPYLKESRDSLEAALDLAGALATERPSLRRVLSFSMWMSRDFVRNVAGITDAELDEIKDQVAPALVWPASSITIEEWDTHTVIFDLQGYRKTIYRPAPWRDRGRPHPIWQHTFGKSADGSSEGGSLEVVLWDDAIKCWAREGRFKGKYWSGESEDEYLFITIPLEQDKLNGFLRQDDDSVDFEYGYRSKPWDKQYWKDDEDKGIGWHLRILDNLAYAER